MISNKVKVFVIYDGTKPIMTRFESGGEKQKVKKGEIVLMEYSKADAMNNSYGFRIINPNEVPFKVIEKLCDAENRKLESAANARQKYLEEAAEIRAKEAQKAEEAKKKEEELKAKEEEEIRAKEAQKAEEAKKKEEEKSEKNKKK